MEAPGTITIKVILDTEEAEAKLAALRRQAADLCGTARTHEPTEWASAWARSIAEKFQGAVVSHEDAAFLISAIKAHTRY